MIAAFLSSPQLAEMGCPSVLYTCNKGTREALADVTKSCQSWQGCHRVLMKEQGKCHADQPTGDGLSVFTRLTPLRDSSRWSRPLSYNFLRLWVPRPCPRATCVPRTYLLMSDVSSLWGPRIRLKQLVQRLESCFLLSWLEWRREDITDSYLGLAYGHFISSALEVFLPFLAKQTCFAFSALCPMREACLKTSLKSYGWGAVRDLRSGARIQPSAAPR